MSYVQVVHGLQRERLAYIFLRYGRLDVVDSAFVLEDINGTRVQIPVGAVTVLFLEPGTSVTHAAVGLASANDTLLLFVGEDGSRTYAVGRGVSGDPQNLLRQVAFFNDSARKLLVVRRMYELRFGEPVPAKRSIEQLRGIEGARIRETYKLLARQYGVEWRGRDYDSSDWNAADPINRALSVGNACLHGLAEAVIHACGYGPALGFIHAGGRLSFVYDLADLYKAEFSIPIAFRLAARGTFDIESRVRAELRQQFRSSRLVNRMALDLERMFSEDAQ